MLELPEKFKISIINRYQEEGKEWLNKIDGLIEKYKKLFGLENIRLVENLSINLVFFAQSSQFGEVVVKLGLSKLVHEINLMKSYASDFVPKCYYSNTKDGILVLERISPGYSLHSLENLEERIKIFSNLANHLLVKATENVSFPTFEELFVKDLKYAQNNKPLFKDILWMIDIADLLYHEVQKMNLPNYILHDDLHHGNILKSGNTWKVIDPHGIIGERAIETSQFIRAELKNTNFEENRIDEIASLVSYHFKEDKELILKTLYFYIIRKMIWQTKIKSDAETISYLTNICRKLLLLLNINS